MSKLSHFIFFVVFFFFTIKSSFIHGQTIDSILDSDITIGDASWPDISSSSGNVDIKQGVPDNTTITIDNMLNRGGNNNDMSYYTVINGDLTIDENQTLIVEKESYLVVNGNLTVNGTFQYNNCCGNSKDVYLIVLGNIEGSGTISGGTGTHDNPPYVSGTISITEGHKGTDGNIIYLDSYIVTILENAGYDLPVELISFNASKEENSIQLEWSTASEINASHFEVYSSMDNENWNLLGDVDANGNSATRIDYSFIDDQEYQSTVYYKLIQYDFDGKNETFGPLVVHFTNNDNALTTTVFPNPSATGKTSIQIGGINQGTNTSLQLINKEGRVVLFDNIDNSNITSTVYQLGDKVALEPGLYILKVNSGVFQSTKKIIIQ